MIVEIGIVVAKVLLVLIMVLNLAGIMGWVERKGSALIQDRIGANRASILGFAGLGLINTMVADPIKFLTKEDFVPPRGDRVLHTLAPCLALFPTLVLFAVIPFGNVLEIGGRTINLQVAPNINIGILYIFAMSSLSVYGIVIGAWASNNKFSLLGGVRGSAQMISYEIAMGLSVMGIVMIYETLELQEIVRGQGSLLWGWLPAWGVVLQPVAFLLFFTTAVAESKRIPFDLPEAESELVAGFHTEYSGAKFLMFFTAEFAEMVTAAAIITTLFFGGWQVPYLMRDGFHFPGGGNSSFTSSRHCTPASGSLCLQGLLFLLAVHFGSMDPSPLSLRSGHAPGVENAPPPGLGQCHGNRNLDHSSRHIGVKKSKLNWNFKP